MFSYLKRLYNSIKNIVYRWLKKKPKSYRRPTILVDKTKAAQDLIEKHSPSPPSIRNDISFTPPSTNPSYPQTGSSNPFNQLHKPLFDNPSELIEPLQIKILKIILANIGVSLVPGILLTFIKNEFDAFFAVKTFLNALKFDYDKLLRNEEQQIVLNKLIGIIAEVDHIRREAKLKDSPLYKVAAKHDLKLLEEMVQHLKKAAAVIEDISRTDCIFPDYQDFCDDARNHLEDWHTIKPSELEELIEAKEEWILVQEEYETLNKKIKHLIKKIADRLKSIEIEDDEHSDRIKTIFERCVNDINEFRQEISHGNIRIADTDIIAELNEFYQDLQDLIEVIESEETDIEEETDTEEEKIKECLSILGLTYPEGKNREIIKKKYKELVRKHHPDIGGDEETMKRINEAYEYLNEHLEDKL